MSLSITIETEADCFKRLKSEWLELLSRAITNTPFQTPQFLETWWKTLGSGMLQIIVIRDESNTLRGIAPLFVQENSSGKQEVCFIGCITVADYLDLIIDAAFQREVYEIIFQTLTKQIKWEELYWCSLPETSPTRHFLKSYFSQAIETIQDITPQITLPLQWEEYLSFLNRKQRHEIKRKWRRLQEFEHTFEVITEETAATDAVDEFIELHRASSAEKSSFWNAQHLVFFKKLISDTAKIGWLKLFFLQIEKKRVATMLVFDYNHKYDLYNSGFYPDLYRAVGTGTILTAYTIKHAIENKKTIYDFLRGGEEYKFRLGAIPKNIYDIAVKK